MKQKKIVVDIKPTASKTALKHGGSESAEREISSIILMDTQTYIDKLLDDIATEGAGEGEGMGAGEGENMGR